MSTATQRTSKSAQLFDHVNQQVESIRKRLSHQQQVEFVFHAWIEFPNLATNGFKFKSIPQAEIPRMVAIPIIAYPDTLFDSRKSRRLNKYVPVERAYQQEVKASLVDLNNRFGKYGMVTLPSLSCDLDGIDKSLEIFELLVSPMRDTGMPMQDYLRFLGKSSPIESQLTLKSKRHSLEFTAEEMLSKMFNSLDSDIYNKAQRLISELAKGIEVAHRKALDPTMGVLPTSIRAINEDRKFKFDLPDERLLVEFPAFDAESKRTTSKSSGDSDDAISKLANTVERLVEHQAQASVDSVSSPEGIDMDALAELVAQKMRDSSGEEVSAEDVVSSLITPDTTQPEGKEPDDLDLEEMPNPDVEDSFPPDGKQESEEEETTTGDPFDFDNETTLCAGVTVSGSACKAMPIADSDYCYNHQSQGVITDEEE